MVSNPAEPEEGRQLSFIRLALIGLGILVLLTVAALKLSEWTGSTMPFLALLGLLALAGGLRALGSPRPEAAPAAFTALLVIIASGLAAGLEVYRLEGDIERMNTIFKFYLQVWVMLSLASAFLVWKLLAGRFYSFPLRTDRGRYRLSQPTREAVDKHLPPRRGKAGMGVMPGERLSITDEDNHPSSLSAVSLSTGLPTTVSPLRGKVSMGARWGVGRRIWLGALAFLILSAAIYPVLGTQARLKTRFDTTLPMTLNGMAYMENVEGHNDQNGRIDLTQDYEAIRWLQQNVEGSPVVLEGLTPNYRWGGRISIYTGLPTIVGWGWHQEQQRWGYRWAVNERINQVNTIYNTTDTETALRLLREYDVRYIVVGQLERLYYEEQGLAKFENGLLDGNLERVFENEDVKIYRLLPFTS